MVAAAMGQVEVCRILLERNSDVHHRDVNTLNKPSSAEIAVKNLLFKIGIVSPSELCNPSLSTNMGL